MAHKPIRYIIIVRRQMALALLFCVHLMNAIANATIGIMGIFNKIYELKINKKNKVEHMLLNWPRGQCVCVCSFQTKKDVIPKAIYSMNYLLAAVSAEQRSNNGYKNFTNTKEVEHGG